MTSAALRGIERFHLRLTDLMRHDAKLGLALGMLVIGFAVALCFPRQPQSAVWLKQEAPAPIADSELDFLPIRAYQPPPADAASRSSRAASDTAPASGAVPVVASPEEAFTHTAPAPEPIAAVRSDAPLTEVLAPNKGADALPGSPASAAGKPAPATPEKGAQQTYTVRAGDTLSGIAGRCLGSTARYLELYAANQDRLTSPDDLRIGLELVIPAKDQPAAVAARAKGPDAAGSKTELQKQPAESVPALAERPEVLR